MPATGGRVLAEVTNAIVRLHSRYYGKGPTKSKSFLMDDVLVCVMRDVYTTVERTLIETGKFEQVRRTRHVFQRAMEREFVDAVEGVLGREVATFMSQVSTDPDVAVDVFILESEEG